MKTTFEDEEVENFGIRPETSKTFHQFSEIYNFQKHRPLVIQKQYVIGNITKLQVEPIIIVENMIHGIINLNLLIITNFNSVVIIKQ